MVKGNKGEWSEFYAFLKILTDRKLFAADENLELLRDKFYVVLKIIREEAKTGKKSYDIASTDDKIIISDENGSQIEIIDSEKIKSKVSAIFEKMQTATDTTFEISLANEAMQDLHCTKIKAGNNRKADLVAVIHDRISPTMPELGFSVKSMLGGAATLLNASGATNFTYKISGFEGDASVINDIKSSAKVRSRIMAIEANGGKLIFDSIEDQTFKRNLMKVDTILPVILSELVKAFFEDKGKTMPELVEAIAENETLRQFGFDKNDYEYKLKNFLVAIALDMTPATTWDGLSQAHGGYIVVKDNGEIACYHLYNRDEFQEYLYRNTKFETPSTTRHKFASIYTQDGELKIKLNLQIRFLR